MNAGLSSESFEALSDLACRGDLPALRELVRQGASLNITHPKLGDSLLEKIVMNLCYDQPSFRYEVVRELLAFGADPNFFGSEANGPLFPAVLAMDTEMLRLLLEAGADPNLPHDLGESLYAYAEFDYRYQIYDLHLPEEPTVADRVDEDAWLRFLDRLALKHSRRRPDHLQLLRQYGARREYEPPPSSSS